MNPKNVDSKYVKRINKIKYLDLKILKITKWERIFSRDMDEILFYLKTWKNCNVLFYWIDISLKQSKLTSLTILKV